MRVFKLCERVASCAGLLVLAPAEHAQLAARVIAGALRQISSKKETAPILLACEQQMHLERGDDRNASAVRRLPFCSPTNLFSQVLTNGVSIFQEEFLDALGSEEVR